jgi:hypothetical protein
LGNTGAATVEVQPPATGVAVAVAIGEPLGLDPAQILTVTGVVSLAVPAKEGVLLLDGDGGELNVTVGGAVFTTNVTGLLLPGGFPRELCWVAVAV